MRTLQSELINKGLYPQSNQQMKQRAQQRNQEKAHSLQPKNKKTLYENLSKRDWEEIMGMRRPKYKRNHGAIRQL